MDNLSHTRRHQAPLDTLATLCRAQLKQAELSGLLEKEGHLRRALKAIEDARRSPPAKDLRQGFFAAMLEEPTHSAP